MVPNTLLKPMTSEVNTPKVIQSWLTVPHSPRNLNGAISERYKGTVPVFRPINNNRKKNMTIFLRVLHDLLID